MGLGHQRLLYANRRLAIVRSIVTPSQSGEKMIQFRAFFYALSTAAAVTACADDDGRSVPASVKDQSSPSAVDAGCPAVADSCSASCRAAMAEKYDPERKCRSKESVVIGCQAPEGQATIFTCAVGAHGEIFLGSSSLFEAPKFPLCQMDMMSQAARAPFCE